MLLAIDVGNTNVMIGVFDGERLVHSWRLAALRERTADELGILVTQLFEQTGVAVSAVDGIVVASVVPPLTRPMEEMCERYFRQTALLVDATNAGMPIIYSPAGRRRRRSHRERGRRLREVRQGRGHPADRRGFRHGDDVRRHLADGDYLGGVICPGIGISADALFQRAARLPRVDVRKPPSVIGQTTVTRCSRGCSSATWRWWTGWCGGCAPSCPAASRRS